MVSQSLPRSVAETRPGRLRRLDPARDLGALAHLIEVAFADELSTGARAITREMQAQSLMAPLFWLLSHLSPAFQDMLTGFVWEEDGKLVGNTTVTRAEGSAGDWVISNVAVLPAYRRQGIARVLVRAAIDYARERGGRRIFLQVRADNESARKLYLAEDFASVEAVTELFTDDVRLPRWKPHPRVAIHEPVAARWHEAFDVARASIPFNVQQLRPVRASAYQIRRRSVAERWGEWLLGRSSERWWAELDGWLRGLLTIERRRGFQPHRVEFIIHPDSRGIIESDMVAFALQRLRGTHPVRVHAPTYQPEVIDGLLFAGFREVRTLEQMVRHL